MQIQHELADILEETCPAPCLRTPDAHKFSQQQLVTPEVNIEEGQYEYKGVEPHSGPMNKQY